HVALRPFEDLTEPRLEVTMEHVPRKLNDPPRVFEDLDRLDAGDVIEEPTTAGVHQHRVALHLHKAQNLATVVGAQDVSRVPREERLDARARAVEDHRDVVVTRAPRVVQVATGSLLPRPRDGVAQIVERRAKRRSPSLIP